MKEFFNAYRKLNFLESMLVTFLMFGIVDLSNYITSKIIKFFEK